MKGLEDICIIYKAIKHIIQVYATWVPLAYTSKPNNIISIMHPESAPRCGLIKKR